MAVQNRLIKSKLSAKCNNLVIPFENWSKCRFEGYMHFFNASLYAYALMQCSVTGYAGNTSLDHL